MMDMLRRVGDSLTISLLKITRNFICEELPRRGRAMAVMGFGSRCPWNGSSFLAFLIRHLPASGDNDNSRRAAGRRSQSQTMPFKAPLGGVHGPGCSRGEHLHWSSSSDRWTLGPDQVLPVLARGPAGISTAVERSVFSQLLGGDCCIS